MADDLILKKVIADPHEIDATEETSDRTKNGEGMEADKER